LLKFDASPYLYLKETTPNHGRDQTSSLRTRNQDCDTRRQHQYSRNHGSRLFPNDRCTRLPVVPRLVTNFPPTWHLHSSVWWLG